MIKDPPLIVDWGLHRDIYHYYVPLEDMVSGDQLDWCKENLGYDTAKGRWHWHKAHIYFKRKSDLMWYMLRWSHVHVG